MSDSATLWTVAYQDPLSWNSPGKNTEVSCHALLQGIFLTQGLNPGLPPCRQILYHLSHQKWSYALPVYSFLYLSPLFQTAGRLKQQVPGSGLSSQEAVGAQWRQGQDRFMNVLLDFGPDIHSLGLVQDAAGGYKVPSRVPSPKKAPLQGLSQCSPRLVSAYRVPDHCLRTEWAGVASPRKRGFCASISSCLQEGLTDCCTSSRLSCPGVSVNQDFLILNGEVPTSFWHICLSWLSCSSNTKSRKEQCEALGNQAFKYLIQEPSNQETFWHHAPSPQASFHQLQFNSLQKYTHRVILLCPRNWNIHSKL